MLARVIAQTEHVISVVGILDTKLHRIGVSLGVLGGPRLPGLNVAPFDIEQIQSAFDRLAARFVQTIGFRKHLAVVRGVAARSASLNCRPANSRARSCRR
jgi:hypothetical protein